MTAKLFELSDELFELSGKLFELSGKLFQLVYVPCCFSQAAVDGEEGVSVDGQQDFPDGLWHDGREMRFCENGPDAGQACWNCDNCGAWPNWNEHCYNC